MVFIKLLFILLIFVLCSFMGFLMSKKYKNRIEELREFKNATNILESKIKFTYEPLGDIFQDISKISKGGISNIFKEAKSNIKINGVQTGWNIAVDTSKSKLSLKNEDIDIIKGLGKMLR